MSCGSGRRSPARRPDDLETALVDLRAAVAMRPAWADVLGRMPESISPAARMLADALERS